MGRVSENERDFKAQSYFRLLRYARPYWLRLTIGILAGMTVGGSLFVSLLMIPQLVGVVDPAGAGSAVETKAAPSRLTGEILRALEKPGLTEAEKQEQATLRLEYLAAIRQSLEAQLDNVYIVEADGTQTKLKKKDSPKPPKS